MSHSPDTDNFFVEMQDWSERKLLLLEKYLSASSKVLGSLDIVYYIDGFAGNGVYSDGAKGSPIRAAELAQSYVNEGKSYALRCINIESDQKTFENLQNSTAKYGDLVSNYRGTFVENINRVMAQISNHPIICFLDPFGIKGIDWAAVEEIVSRKAPTDLWLRFDHQMVFRLNGFYGSDDPRAISNFDTLCKVYGISNKEYLHSNLAGSTTEDRKKKAVQLYMRQLCSAYRKVRGRGFAGSYRLRSLDEQEKYFLIFSTAHPKGVTLASEVVFSVEESYKQELEDYRNKGPRQLSIFPDPQPEDVFSAKVDDLALYLKEKCAGNTFSRKSIYIRIFDKWFGRISSKHLTAALRKLEEQGDITHRSGARSRESTKFTFRD